MVRPVSVRFHWNGLSKALWVGPGTTEAELRQLLCAALGLPDDAVDAVFVADTGRSFPLSRVCKDPSAFAAYRSIHVVLRADDSEDVDSHAEGDDDDEVDFRQAEFRRDIGDDDDDDEEFMGEQIGVSAAGVNDDDDDEVDDEDDDEIDEDDAEAIAERTLNRSFSNAASAIPQHQQHQQYQENSPGSRGNGQLIGGAADVSSMFQLDTQDIAKIMQLFAELAPGGFLTRETFIQVFSKFLKEDYRGDQVATGHLLGRLFAVFDTARDSRVSAKELVAGLSLLCSGSQEQKIRLAFSMFDLAQDGQIWFSEMKQYLSSVFRVISSTAGNGDVFERFQISPEELAAVTTEQCFREAGVPLTGALSWEQFYAWYASDMPSPRSAPPSAAAPPAASTQSVQYNVARPPLTASSSSSSSASMHALVHSESSGGASSMSVLPDTSNMLMELSQRLHFDKCTAEEVFDVFADRANDGSLNRNRFRDAYMILMRLKQIRIDPQVVQRDLDRIFDIFDVDGNGLVDFEELSGVSVLCAGSRTDKVLAAFKLYDYNNDGYISLAEMETYMASTFRMLEMAQPGRLPMDPDELAEVTARACFEEADTDGDGRLSFEEFRTWWEKPASIGNAPAPSGNAADTNTAVANADLRPVPLTQSGLSLEQVRALTGIDRFDVFQVFDEFSRHRDEDGDLTYEGYVQAFLALRHRAYGDQPRNQHADHLYRQIIKRLWAIFDQDHNGILSFEEIASGISVLCTNGVGPTAHLPDAKTRAVFSLFDKDNSGYIEPEELFEMLRAVFTVQFELKGLSNVQGLDVDSLARETTMEAFMHYDKNADQRLSFSEFSRWYLSSDSGQAVATIQDQNGPSVSLEEARKLTGLEDLTVEDLLEVFSDVADPTTSGISARAFQTVISNLAPSGADPSKLKALSESIFALYAPAGGLADFRQLLSGLSIMCVSGDPEERAMTCFELFDLNNDEVISREELSQYLFSVYKIMFLLQPSSRAIAGNISAEELARVTAESVFAQADLDKNGLLDWEEFRSWFMDDGSQHPPQPNAQALSAQKQQHQQKQQNNHEDVSSSWISLPEVRRLTMLDRYSPDDAFDILAAQADMEGRLTKDAFFRGFHRIVSMQGGLDAEDDQDRLRLVLHRLFDTLDLNKDNYVDMQELGAGISILCGAPGNELTSPTTQARNSEEVREARVRAVFELYDIDGDGYIQRSELERYLTCVFRVMYATQPSTKSETGGLPAEELARRTAGQIMTECDKNHDDRLNLDEFRAWYSKSTGQQLSVAAELMAADADWFNLDEIRRLTRLHLYNSSELLEKFAEAAVEYPEADDDGFRPTGSRMRRHKTTSNMYISRESFDEVMHELVDQEACQTEDDFVRLTFLMDRLYDMFDYSKDGRVSFSELSTGLMVLAGTETDGDRMATSFALFDEDGDGYVSLSEMIKLMTSTFKVLFEVQPELKERVGNVTPEDLARQTAEQAFLDADLNEDGRLSYEEFTKWVQMSKTGSAVQDLVAQTPSFVSMDEIRKLTKIDRYAAEDISDQFLEFANSNGEIDKKGFLAAFQEIIAEASDGEELTMAQQTRLNVVLDRLFEIFDMDNNGLIDHRELNAGLSILNPTMDIDSKAQLAFELWDLDGSGGISLKEITQYLTSVFTLLFETQPGLKEHVGTTAKELATATAQEIFDSNGLSTDDEIDYPTFRKWYSKGEGASLTQFTETVPMALSLNDIRKLTRFEQYLPNEIFELFAERCPDGTIDRHTFEQVFREISLARPPAFTSDEMDRLHLVINRIFHAFDTDGAGAIEFTDLAAGLSILAGGGKDMRAESCFALYDLNGDGMISKPELYSFLSAVFRVMFALQPSTREQLGGVKPEALAEASMEELFREMDINHDSLISWDEFKRWWDSDAQAALAPGGIPMQSTQRRQGTPPPPPPPSQDMSKMSLSDARRLTGLESMDAADAFEAFAVEAVDGELDRAAFTTVFQRIMRSRSNLLLNPNEQERAAIVVAQLFDVFDQDGNGTVDFLELASGLSVLCKGGEKGGHGAAEAAFRLYDQDSTGTVSRESMEWYLTSVFRLMLETQEGADLFMGNMSAEDLAKVTVEEIFEEADLNRDDELSFAEFKRWWESDDTARAMGKVVGSASGWLSIDELKRITGLGKWAQRDIFEEFALVVDEDGLLTPENFRKVISKFVDRDELSARDIQMLPLVYDALFNIFDADNSGAVDFAELSAGIALLSRDPAHRKAQAAFSLFDEDDDGLLDEDEIQRYLLSVYRLYLSTSPEAQALAGGLSAEELATSTAAQVISDFDMDGDGKLNFEEFRRWMDSDDASTPLKSSNENATIVHDSMDANIGEVEVIRAAPVHDDAISPDWLSLDQVKEITGFGERSASELFEVFAANTNEEGVLSRPAFEDAFNQLVPEKERTPGEYGKLNLVRLRLFDIMDADGNGVVDFAEIAAGLLLLADGGDSDANSKMEELFELYDFAGTGYISRENMEKILLSMFRVIYETDPSSVRRTGGAAPEDLAEACAQSIFEAADTNHDNQLSFDEFKEWFMSSPDAAATLGQRGSSVQRSGPAPVAPMSPPAANGVPEVVKSSAVSVTDNTGRNVVASSAVVLDGDGNTLASASDVEVIRAAPVHDSGVSPDWLSLDQVKEITGFGDCTSSEMFEVFATYTDDNGVLTRPAFEKAFNQLISKKQRSSEDDAKLNLVRLRLFDILDADNNGVVDYTEIAAGLLLLADGNNSDANSKMEELFAVYDYAGSGFISHENMEKILLSMFRVIYETEPSASRRTGGAAPEDLARACAQSIFDAADTNHDDQLSFEEFKEWFESSPGAAEALGKNSSNPPPAPARYADAVATSTPNNVSLEDARRVTGLGKLTTSEVFQEFALATNAEGLLDFDSFASTIHDIVTRSEPSQSKADQVLLEIVTKKLFDAFASDRSSGADFAMVSAGLSILTEDPRDVKISQAFSLFDLDGDGFISRDEMETYLHGVFAALASLAPSQFPEGISPLQLAQATTETAMEEADLDGDERISLEEFTLWFGAGGGGALFGGPDEMAAAAQSQNLNQKAAPISPSELSPPSTPVPLKGLAEVKRLTKLENLELQEVLDTIHSVAGTGKMDFNQFVSVFEMLIEQGGGHESYVDQKAAAEVARALFGVFDSNNDSKVDQRELAAGLSILCSGSAEEKVVSAFSLYDANGDNRVSVEEMTSYLTAVFKVLFAADPEAAKGMGVDPEQLAIITTEQCFIETDADNDGQLTFDEFSSWYRKNQQQ